MSLVEPKNLAHIQELVEDAKYREAIQIINSFEEKEGYSLQETVRWHLLKSICLNNLGQFEEALELAGEVYNKSQEPIQNLDAIIEMAKNLAHLGRIKKCVDLITNAEIRLKKIEGLSSRELKKRRAFINLVKSVIYFQKGEVNKAFEFVEHSLKLQKELGNKHDIAYCLRLLAHKALITGDWDQALNSLNKGLLLEGDGYNNNIPAILLNIGMIYMFKGELDAALQYHKKSLTLFREMGSKLGIANTLNHLGMVYRLQGDFSRAKEHLKQCIKLFEELGNDLYIVQINSCLCELAIDVKDHEKAQLYLKRLKEYKDVNTFYNGIYRECKASLLKLSPRAISRGKAEEIFKQLIEAEGITNETKEHALVNLCDLLLIELHNIGDPELLDEIQQYINQLLDITKKYHSYSLLAETYLLQAKLSLISLNLTEAQKFLIQGQKIAEKCGLTLLVQKISNEHDEFLKQRQMWEDIKNSEISITERIKITRIDEQMKKMVRKREVKLPKLDAEQPVLLTIMSKEGNILLSNPFTADITIDSAFFSEFLASCNTFCDQILSESFDRVKFGQHTVLITAVDSFSICYMFQGQSYSARQKLIHFSEAVKKDPDIMKILEDASSKNIEIKVNKTESLEELIYESFLSDPQQFQMPFEAYEGDGPFVFVSYSHTDRLQVYPIIDYLNKTGKNIWYDEGIPISEDWKKSIVDNLERCSAFLVFITPHIIDSEYVRKEISFALKKKKPFFSIYLKETELPSELEFEIGNIQFMQKYLIPETEFYNKLNRMLDPVLNK